MSRSLQSILDRSPTPCPTISSTASLSSLCLVLSRACSDFAVIMDPQRPRACLGIVDTRDISQYLITSNLIEDALQAFSAVPSKAVQYVVTRLDTVYVHQIMRREPPSLARIATANDAIDLILACGSRQVVVRVEDQEQSSSESNIATATNDENSISIKTPSSPGDFYGVVDVLNLAFDVVQVVNRIYEKIPNSKRKSWFLSRLSAIGGTSLDTGSTATNITKSNTTRTTNPQNASNSISISGVPTTTANTQHQAHEDSIDENSPFLDDFAPNAISGSESSINNTDTKRIAATSNSSPIPPTSTSNIHEGVSQITLQKVVKDAEFVWISENANILEACKTMYAKEFQVAAIVIDQVNSTLVGIITPSDLVRRGLGSAAAALGLAPSTTSKTSITSSSSKTLSSPPQESTYPVLVGEIMTKNPDTMKPSDNVVDALHRMQACKYRNMPVVSPDTIYGVVDVVELSNKLLTLAWQAHQTATTAAATNSSTAAKKSFWNFLWSSKSQQDSAAATATTAAALNVAATAASPVSAALKLVATYTDSMDPQQAQVPKLAIRDKKAVVLDEQIVFKFKDENRDFVRLAYKPNVALAYNMLVHDIADRCKFPYGQFRIKYLDDEGDPVVIKCNEDVAAVVALAKECAWKVVKLIIEQPSPGSASAPSQSIKDQTHYQVTASEVSSSAINPSSHTTTTKGSTALLDQQLNEAERLLRDSKLEHAIQAYSRAIAQFQDSPRAFHGRATAYIIMGSSKEAQSDFQKCVDLCQDQDIADQQTREIVDSCHGGLVEAFIDQICYEDAVRELLKINDDMIRLSSLEALVEEADNVFMLSSEAMGDSAWMDAIESLNQFIRLNHLLTDILHRHKDLFPTPIPPNRPLWTKNTQCYMDRARCYANIEDWEHALEDAQYAFRENVEPEQAKTLVRKCLAKLGREGETEIVLHKEEKKAEIHKLGNLLKNINF